MAKTEYISLQRGNFNTHLWELKQDSKNRNHFLLEIKEVEVIEKEVFSTEIREVPKEESKEVRAVDGDGKVLFNNDKTPKIETIIKKTFVSKEIKISQMVRDNKIKVIKKLDFYFKPFHFQIINTVKNYINSLN